MTLSSNPRGSITAGRTSRRKVAGTSLVEVLVVIVVFLVGILALMQIFPGGLRILSLNRSSTMATELADDEMERVVGRSDQLPEAILPVTYVWDNTLMPPRVVTKEDRDRSPNDIGMVYGDVNQTGVVVDAGGNNLGYWPLLSGANLVRRVIGEGRRVPAPRQVGDHFGGLMVLQFTPIIFNAADPGRFVIYGADLVRREGEPLIGETLPSFEYYVRDVDQATASVTFPADPFRTRTYRLGAAFYTQVGPAIKKRDVVDRVVTVPPQASGIYELSLSAGDMPTNPPLITGEPFVSVELESIRVARRYEPLGLAANFDDPYQYKMLDEDLGLILFSELSYNAFELRGGRRVPLQAKVNYDVYDWRIMRDEFRVPQGELPRNRLALGGLKRKGDQDVDGIVNQGLNLNVPTGLGTFERRDLVIMDLDTGGILLEQSASRTDGGSPRTLVRVDRSVGLLTFNDADGNPANGVQGELVLPKRSAPVDVNLTGRAFRAMYQARNEWSVQVLKAPSVFTQSAMQPGIAEYYVGDTDATVGGSASRLYFPRSMIGFRVTVDEIWYQRVADSTTRLLENQSFVVQARPSDPTGLAYVDLTSADSNANAFDATAYGYAVRGVRGATVSVRVLWNPSTLSFTSNSPTNLRNLDIWGRDWRRSTNETFLRRDPQ